MADSSLPSSFRFRSPSVRLRGYSSMFLGRLDILLVTTMLLGQAIHVTSILDTLYQGTYYWGLLIQYVIFAIYLVLAFFDGRPRILAFCLSYAAFLMFQCVLWSQYTGQNFNFNNALAYGTVIMAVVFYQSRLPLGLILRLIFYVSLGYLLLYVVFYDVIVGRPDEGGRLVLPSDGSREARVFLAGSFAVFVLGTAIVGLKQAPVRLGAAAALSIFAIYLSYSRMFQALTCFVIILALIMKAMPFLTTPINRTVAFLFIVICSLMLLGFFYTDWNPYSFFVQDASGRARYLEYGDAVKAVGDRYLLGLGIPPSLKDLAYYIRPRQQFFEADLGIAGVFFNMGLVGSIFIMTLTTACFFAVPSRRINAPLAWGLYITAYQGALYTFFSPAMWGGSSTIFGALTVAIWLKGGYFNERPIRDASRLNEVDPTATNLEVIQGGGMSANRSARSPVAR